MTRVEISKMPGLLFKIAVQNRLKNACFTKYSSLSVFRSGEVNWLVDLQRSSWNDSESVDLTINVGCYVDGVWEAFSGISSPKKIKIANCIAHGRVGRFLGHTTDKWWRFEKGMSDSKTCIDEAAAEIGHVLEKSVLPFIDAIPDSVHLGEYLLESEMGSYLDMPPSKCQRTAFAAILFSKSGQTVKAKKAILQAREESKGSPLEEIVSAIAFS